MSVYNAVEGCFSRHRRAVREFEDADGRSGRMLRLQGGDYFTALFDDCVDKQYFVARLERPQSVKTLYVVTRRLVEFASAPKMRWQGAMIIVTNAMEDGLAALPSISTSVPQAIETANAISAFAERCRD